MDKDYVRFASLEEIRNALFSININNSRIQEVCYLIQETIDQGYNIYNGEKAKSN